MSNIATIQKAEESTSVKDYVLYGAAGVIILGGGFLLVRHVIRSFRERREQNKSFEEGTAATYAKQIKMAFDNDGWFGTNLTELRRIIREIPSKEDFMKVAKSYQKLYSRNMFKDMEDELKSSEYNEMLSIVAAKPERANGKPTYNYLAWAKRLKAAFEKTYGFIPGTDEEAIKAVFLEIPSQAAFVEVGNAYQKEYGTNLITDLKSELEMWEYGDYMKIILTKPKQ